MVKMDKLSPKSVFETGWKLAFMAVEYLTDSPPKSKIKEALLQARDGWEDYSSMINSFDKIEK